MYFEIIIVWEEMLYLEKAANNLMRIEHVRKTDRKIIVESFKEIKEKLEKISAAPCYMLVGSDKEELPPPSEAGCEGFTWNAGKWNLAFVGPGEEDLHGEEFLEARKEALRIIDYECSWDMK